MALAPVTRAHWSVISRHDQYLVLMSSRRLEKLENHAAYCLLIQYSRKALQFENEVNI